MANTSRRARLFGHVANELFYMGRFIVAGGVLAAALQTIVPQSILSGLANHVFASVFALMLLAFVLSLCSEADAFVAVSLTQFPIAGQLAFLVFGPVLDVKLSFLLRGELQAQGAPHDRPARGDDRRRGRPVVRGDLRVRHLRVFALGLWAALFWWLWLSGASVRFVGPRTWWIVPFGAIGLTVTTLGAAVSKSDDRPGTPVAALAALALLVPVLLLVLVPSPRLGATAAAKRAGGLTAGGLIPPPGGDGELSIRDIEYATSDSDYAATLGVVEGAEVGLIGFVTHPDRADDYALTRFEMWCCAADAIPSSVVVIDSTDYPDDTWFRVKGVLVPAGSGFAVEAKNVERVPEPSNPYA